MLHTWVRQPLNLGLLKNAFNVLGPLLSQFRRSFYVFCFHLPRPFSAFFSTFGNYWFLRIMHNLGKGRPEKGQSIIGRLNPKEAGESMAISTGPGMQQLQDASSKDGSLRYGESVRKRVHDHLSRAIHLRQVGEVAGDYGRVIRHFHRCYTSFLIVVWSGSGRRDRRPPSCPDDADAWPT
jgi:hypothetical protein